MCQRTALPTNDREERALQDHSEHLSKIPALKIAHRGVYPYLLIIVAS